MLFLSVLCWNLDQVGLYLHDNVKLDGDGMLLGAFKWYLKQGIKEFTKHVDKGNLEKIRVSVTFVEMKIVTALFVDFAEGSCCTNS